MIGIAAILLLFTAITALVTKPLWSQPELIRPAAAQASAANASDIAAAGSPINGVWNSQGRPYLDLQFDGRGNVTGTAVWWDGPNGNRVPIGAGTFDSNTGALRLEGEGPPFDGVPSRYVIVGTLENDTLSGEYAIGPRKGTFAFTR